MLPIVLSHSRAVLTNHYALLPEIGFQLSFLPHFEKTRARIQASPEIGRAGFAQMLLEIDPGGGTINPVNDGLEHFFYILSGSLHIQAAGEEKELSAAGYVYIPEGMSFSLHNPTENICRVEWIKRPYKQAGYPTPSHLFGDKNQVPLVPYAAIPGCYSQFLLPEEDMAFDMSIKVIQFDPGVNFDVVETHIHEHGLYMLAGSGLYYLGDKLYEVQATDFIWMAPYCPQYFISTGWERSAYLLYKNINRDVSF
jgi:(S)-ureidoglycine aminohydrolase